MHYLLLYCCAFFIELFTYFFFKTTHIYQVPICKWHLWGYKKNPIEIQYWNSYSSVCSFWLEQCRFLGKSIRTCVVVFSQMLAFSQYTTICVSRSSWLINDFFLLNRPQRIFLQKSVQIFFWTHINLEHSKCPQASSSIAECFLLLVLNLAPWTFDKERE